MGVEQLVQHAVVAVDDQHVAVAIAIRPAFDRRVRRNGIRPGIALVVVGERDRARAACEPGTETNGMPFGAPFQTVPKSGWSPTLGPMLAM